MTAHGNVNGIYLQNTSIYNYLNNLDANYTYATFASSGSNYGITDYPIDGLYEYFCFRANHIEHIEDTCNRSGGRQFLYRKNI